MGWLANASVGSSSPLAIMASTMGLERAGTDGVDPDPARRVVQGGAAGESARY
jgi:hypothetical protein